MKASSVFKIAGWVLLGVCVAAALAFVLGIVVMALWNWLVPVISNGAIGEITYWQAVGLFILCHLLFKSHHEGHHNGPRKNTHGLGSRFASRVRGMIKGDREDARPDDGADLAQPEA